MKSPTGLSVSDKGLIVLITSYILIGVFGELLSAGHAISHAQARVLQIAANFFAGASLFLLAFQGAFFWRSGCKERRWPLQLFGSIVFALLLTASAIVSADFLEKQMAELTDPSAVISDGTVVNVMARSDVPLERKVSLSLMVASNAYIRTGVIRMTLDGEGKPTPFEPTEDDKKLRSLVEAVTAPNFRPTHEETIGLYAVLVCMVGAIVGYFSARQFSNRAPNASV